MLQFLDEIEPLDDEWTAWAAGHDPPPVWLAQVDTSDTGPRLLGAFVTPAAVVLGMRSWDDADEGAHPAPYALFDVEKLVRMALHQSGLAFEALCSPRTWGSEFPARRLAGAAVTHGILAYYRDVTAPLEQGRVETWRWRTLLTGALLARDGVVSQSMSTLCSRLHVSDTADAAVIRRLRETLETSSHLAESPADYEFLNSFVVAARLGAS